MWLLYLLAFALVGWVQLPVQLLAQTYESNFYNCNNGYSVSGNRSTMVGDKNLYSRLFNAIVYT